MSVKTIVIRLLSFVVLICLLMVGFAKLSPIATAPAESYVAGDVLLKFADGIHLSEQARVAPEISVFSAPHRQQRIAQLNQLLRQTGAYRADPIDAAGSNYRVAFDNPNRSIPQLVELFAKEPTIDFAEPNYRRHMFRMPNDPNIEHQWALQNIQAFEAWDITTGKEIVIAIVDTGISESHPDLKGKVLPGYNAIFDNEESRDNHGHGTAVAGLIAANTDNNSGIAGMCWGCRVLPVKVLDAFGAGEDDDLARGIRWAADQGVRIINLSLGGAENSQTLREAVEYAYNKGVLMVASSGNDHQLGNATNYPAAYPQVMAIGATTNADKVALFSNTGDYIDLVAPGVALWTTTIDGDYGPPNGTSFSSPFVAGVAGLIWSLRPELASTDVACILKASSDDRGASGRDDEYGWGRLNAFRAVQLAQSYTSCPLNEPAPDTHAPTPEPTQHVAPNAFAPISLIDAPKDSIYFPETQHTLRGAFLQYWQQHGGLAIFGYPISEEFSELDRSGSGELRVVQYFERHRLELHPANAPPYHVQLTRLGDEVLHLQGRDWFTFPKGTHQSDCLFFEGTGHSICGSFLDYWSNQGLELDGIPGKSFGESLALFGQPISEVQAEEVAPGVWLQVQWFERARLEDHGTMGILPGLLGNEFVEAQQ